MAYAHNLLKGTEIYLADERVKIDNDLVENAIRPVALGRRSHLFVGSPEAGGGAMLYSLLMSAKVQGADPQAYLGDLIVRLPRAKTAGLDALTPANWARAHKAAQKERPADAATRVA